MKFINSRIAQYTESYTTPEPEIVQRLIQASDQDLDHTDMLSGRQVGQMLRFLVQLAGAKRVLEIGTFTGYSAMMMASAMKPGDELITIEMNQRYKKVSAQFFEEEPFDDIIFQIMGNALEIVPRLEGRFDFIYLDGDKVNYPKYYRLLKEKISSGGMLVVDNVLWGGEVLDKSNSKAKAIQQLNSMIRDDKQTEQVMLPVRDGLTLVKFQ